MPRTYVHVYKKGDGLCKFSVINDLWGNLQLEFFPERHPTMNLILKSRIIYHLEKNINSIRRNRIPVLPFISNMHNKS